MPAPKKKLNLSLVALKVLTQKETDLPQGGGNSQPVCAGSRSFIEH